MRRRRERGSQGVWVYGTADVDPHLEGTPADHALAPACFGMPVLTMI